MDLAIEETTMFGKKNPNHSFKSSSSTSKGHIIMNCIQCAKDLLEGKINKSKALVADDDE